MYADMVFDSLCWQNHAHRFEHVMKKETRRGGLLYPGRKIRGLAREVHGLMGE